MILFCIVKLKNKQTFRSVSIQSVICTKISFFCTFTILFFKSNLQAGENDDNPHYIYWKVGKRWQGTGEIKIISHLDIFHICINDCLRIRGCAGFTLEKLILGGSCILYVVCTLKQLYVWWSGSVVCSLNSVQCVCVVCDVHFETKGSLVPAAAAVTQSLFKWFMLPIATMIVLILMMLIMLVLIILTMSILVMMKFVLVIKS